MRYLYGIVKYIPIVFGVLLILHCMLLLKGYDAPFFKEFCTFNWVLAIIVTILSYKFKFCIYHRLFIWYDFLLDLCIKGQRYDVFNSLGIDVLEAREFVLMIGICIQYLLMYRVIYGCREESNV